MSHSYPLAKNAKAAIKPGLTSARTRAEAETLAPDHEIDSLQTDWLPMSEADAQALFDRKDEEDTASGFLQRYEDEKGGPVVAVTYWKIVAKAPKKAPKAPQTAPKEPRNAPELPETASKDHTDDLYFRRGRTKPRRKKVDPNQMDLFGKVKEED